MKRVCGLFWPIVLSIVLPLLAAWLLIPKLICRRASAYFPRYS